MACERRTGTNRKYVYLTRRRGAVFERIYFGPSDSVTGRCALLQSAELARVRRSESERRSRLKAADRTVRAVAAAAKQLAAETLIAVGYQPDGHGHWRLSGRRGASARAGNPLRETHRGRLDALSTTLVTQAIVSAVQILRQLMPDDAALTTLIVDKAEAAADPDQVPAERVLQRAITLAEVWAMFNEGRQGAQRQDRSVRRAQRCVVALTWLQRQVQQRLDRRV